MFICEIEKNQQNRVKGKLVGGFKDFLFSPLPGEDSQFDSYFSKGLKPPTRKFLWLIPGVFLVTLLDPSSGWLGYPGWSRRSRGNDCGSFGPQNLHLLVLQL